MIPNGCDTKLFTPAAKSPLKIPGISSKDFVAGFTGAHGKANGLSILIDVAYRLQQMGRDDIKLLLIGDGAEKPALVKRSQEMGLKNIIFHPPIRKSELASITASLGCGLMLLANIPAFYRGTSPNKFFDYISSGIPVVTNYPGWISEIIVKEEAGVTTPPDNPSRLAEAIVRLCDNPDLCAKMGAAGRILAENVFARDKNASAFADWLEMHAK
jgi:glycosyltransferase involved in cell wall biosynthesis